jgi:chromosome segregation ATPase
LAQHQIKNRSVEHINVCFTRVQGLEFFFKTMKAFFFSFFFVLTLSAAQAQGTTKEGTPASNSLAKQFNDLKNNANSYTENNRVYKVVSVTALDAFWKNVQATMEAREKELKQAGIATEQELAQAKEDISQQNSQLQALKQQYAEKEKEVQQNAHDVANLSVLGIDMEKQNYVILTFGIIIALLLVLGIILLQYKSSKQVAIEKQKAFNEIDTEYNEYKKAAREKELKVKRELQTEMNRIEELNQQIASLKKQSHA